LLVESALGDVLSVLAVGFLLDFRTSSNGTVGNLLAGLFSQVGVSILAALAAGFAWTRLLPRLSEQRFWQVLTFSMVLLLYAATEAVHASGLLAVLGFGLALANLPSGKRMQRDALWASFLAEPDHPRQIHDFHAELAFLVRTFFFVLIGAVVELRGLEAIWPLVLGSIGAIFLARWVAVQCVRPLLRELSQPERETILWILPRGLITVVLALQVVDKQGSEFAFLPALAFASILVTNLIVIFGSLRLRQEGDAPLKAEAEEV
jgi:cell volume regulation protein A